VERQVGNASFILAAEKPAAQFVLAFLSGWASRLFSIYYYTNNSVMSTIGLTM
jgi:hypothetical protein